MSPRSLPDKQNVSKEPPKQPKCLPGVSQTSKVFPRSLPDSQNVSQELARQAKCVPESSQTTKMFPRSVPDSQNVSQESLRQVKCLPEASQTIKMIPTQQASRLRRDPTTWLVHKQFSSTMSSPNFTRVAKISLQGTLRKAPVHKHSVSTIHSPKWPVLRPSQKHWFISNLPRQLTPQSVAEIHQSSQNKLAKSSLNTAGS